MAHRSASRLKGLVFRTDHCTCVSAVMPGPRLPLTGVRAAAAVRYIDLRGCSAAGARPAAEAQGVRCTRPLPGAVSDPSGPRPERPHRPGGSRRLHGWPWSGRPRAHCGGRHRGPRGIVRSHRPCATPPAHRAPAADWHFARWDHRVPARGAHRRPDGLEPRRADPQQRSGWIGRVGRPSRNVGVAARLGSRAVLAPRLAARTGTLAGPRRRASGLVAALDVTRGSHCVPTFRRFTTSAFPTVAPNPRLLLTGAFARRQPRDIFCLGGCAAVAARPRSRSAGR